MWHRQNLFMESYYDTLCWETVSKRPLLISFLSLCGYIFSLCLAFSLGLGYTDVRLLKDVRLEKGGLQTETCGRYPLQYLPWGREGRKAKGCQKSNEVKERVPERKTMEEQWLKDSKWSWEKNKSPGGRLICPGRQCNVIQHIILYIQMTLVTLGVGARKQPC